MLSSPLWSSNIMYKPIEESIRGGDANSKNLELRKWIFREEKLGNTVSRKDKKRNSVVRGMMGV